MRTLLQTLICSLACLLASATSTAVPIQFEIENGSVPGFSYSQIHSCESASCMSGSYLTSLSGTLDGDLENGALLNLQGVVELSDPLVGNPATSFNVTGSFDFTPGGSGGQLAFEGLGTFSFANASLAGPANSFDGTTLYAWGASAGSPRDIFATNGFVFEPRLGMDLGGTVGPIPEPSAALLFGLGSLVIAGRVRR